MRLGTWAAVLAGFGFWIWACIPKAVAFNVADLGAPDSGSLIELYRPAGTGPFPAVVVLHPCSGVGRSTRTWARRLQSWGYIAAVVDSFKPRHTSNVCGLGREVPEAARAADAFDAASLLRSLPEVNPDRIALIGMSHGAGGVLAAAAKGSLHPFRAAVALYPWCPLRAAELRTDTLILIGEADDWTPAARCISYAAAEAAVGHNVELRTYPGALHAFDNGMPISTYYGHQIGSDPQAAADATARIHSFLTRKFE